jgi:HEPN domain-containing protein
LVLIKPETKQWLEIAEGDYELNLHLFKRADYGWAVYIMCQAIEKLLKSAQIEVAGTTPRKIHQLARLAKGTGLSFSD